MAVKETGVADGESFAVGLLDAIRAHTAVIDRTGRITHVNSSWRSFSAANGGDDECTGVGVDYLEVCRRAARRGHVAAQRVADGIRSVLDGRAVTFTTDYECPSPTMRRWFRMTVRAMPQPHGGAVVFHEPVTRLKEQAARLERLADHDALTGLPNRSSFTDRLQDALEKARSGNPQPAVIICDLDNFKDVNGALGHHAGDLVLVEVAKRLRAAAGDGMLARLGGDEFILLVHDGSRCAGPIAQRITAAVGQPIELPGGASVNVGVSIGIAVGGPAVDGGSLVRDADTAMHKAKRTSKRSISWFDEELRQSVIERLALQQDLPAAFARRQFLCRFQPELAIDDGRLFSLEALVRWQHPERGRIAPGRFVPIIEDCGASNLLFDHVLETTLAAQRTLREQLGWWPDVSVNLSAHQLDDATLPQTVASRLETAGCPPRCLWLEVTETAAAEVASPTVFDALHALGVSLAIDDFGTGMSSMSRLATRPWDLLKIDRSFVAPLGGDDERAHHVVEAIIAMAHTLELRVVAEGVETATQLAVLRDLGCDVAQGYLISRPVRLETLQGRLTADGRWAGWDGSVAPAP